MIIQHLPHEKAVKSSFARLASYISSDQNKKVRVEQVTITNCVSSDLQNAVTEIELVQSLNMRSKADKTYHLVVSFPQNEIPTKNQLCEIEKEICQTLGFDGHQRISAIHNDTDNFHVHIAINKIHPMTFNSHEPYYPYKKLMVLAAKIEKKYNLVQIDHRPKQTLSQSKAKNMEMHTGQQSFISFMKENLLADLKNSKTLDDFIKILNDRNVKIVKKVNGYVFQSGEIVVKASSIDRSFSFANLNNKFENLNDFLQNQKIEDKPSNNYKKELYKKKPLKDNKSLWNEFKYFREIKNTGNNEFVKSENSSLKADLNVFRAEYKLRTSLIKLLDDSPFVKRILYRQAANAYRKKIEHRRQQTYKLMKARYAEKNMSWKDWLRAKATDGDKQALQMLRRGQKGEVAFGHDVLVAKTKMRGFVPAKFDSITKEGTIIYSPVLRENHNTIYFDVKKATSKDMQQFFELVGHRSINAQVLLQGSDQVKQIFDRLNHAGQSGKQIGIDGRSGGLGGTRPVSGTTRAAGAAARTSNQWYKFASGNAPDQSHTPKLAGKVARPLASLRDLQQRNLVRTKQAATGVLPDHARSDIRGGSGVNQPVRRGVRR